MLALTFVRVFSNQGKISKLTDFSLLCEIFFLGIYFRDFGFQHKFHTLWDEIFFTIMKSWDIAPYSINSLNLGPTKICTLDHEEDGVKKKNT